MRLDPAPNRPTLTTRQSLRKDPKARCTPEAAPGALLAPKQITLIQPITNTNNTLWILEGGYLVTLRLNNQEVAKNSSGVLLKVLKVAHKFFLMT